MTEKWDIAGRRGAFFFLKNQLILSKRRLNMTTTPSTMLALGTQAPDFALPDVVTGRIISLGSFKTDEAFLVMFISRHCPYVQHVKQELARLGRDYIPRGGGMVAICANDPQRYPADSPEPP